MIFCYYSKMGALSNLPKRGFFQQQMGMDAETYRQIVRGRLYKLEVFIGPSPLRSRDPHGRGRGMMIGI